MEMLLLPYRMGGALHDTHARVGVDRLLVTPADKHRQRPSKKPRMRANAEAKRRRWHTGTQAHKGMKDVHTKKTHMG